MAHQTYSRTGQKWLADKESKLVHDLDRETPACGIHETLAGGRALSFVPDRLSQATREEFQPCPACVEESKDSAPAGRPDESSARDQGAS